MNESVINITGTPYVYNASLEADLTTLSGRILTMRSSGKLSPDVLYRIRQYFRIKDIYNSNAIEGNVLGVGETRQVVERGLTITGVPLKDQAEARNLSHALDFLEKLASDTELPITERDIRSIHRFVLEGIHDEAGAYRTVPVTISGSNHSPPGPETIPADMEKFGTWLSCVSIPEDEFATVTGLIIAAVAHTWFVTIHPFIDGNGRVARLLMNLLLMRYGYPIAIIEKDDRFRYYDSLENSHESDLTSFVTLLRECIMVSLQEYEAAAEEQRERPKWAATLAERFTRPERKRAENEYEVWKNAMELLKSQLQQTIDIFNQAATEYGYGGVYLKDFGNLEFEKYSALRRGQSAKRTWFFRIDFTRGETTVRYLFFFGHASPKMRNRCDVTLRLARENPPNSYRYERLENIRSGVARIPDVAEVGYELGRESFVIQPRKVSAGSRSRMARVEDFIRQFFEEVVNNHFGEINREIVEGDIDVDYGLILGENNREASVDASIASQIIVEIRELLKNNDNPVLTAALGSDVEFSARYKKGHRWSGYKTLTEFLVAVFEEVKEEDLVVEGGWVWNRKVHRKPKPTHIPAQPWAEDLDGIVLKAMRTAYLPRVDRRSWDIVLEAFAEYGTAFTAEEYNLTQCTSWVRDRLAEQGVHVGRQILSDTFHATKNGGVDMRSRPNKEEMRKAILQNTLSALERQSVALSDDQKEQLGRWLGG